MRAIATPNTPDTIGGGKTGAAALPARLVGHAGSAGIVAPGHPAYHSPCIVSVWEPDASERAGLATGAMLELIVYGQHHPPVNVGVTRDAISTGVVAGPSAWLEIDEPAARDLIELLKPLGCLPGPMSTGTRQRMRMRMLRSALEAAVAELEAQR